MTDKEAAKRLPVAGPWITQHEIDMVAEAAASAWYDDANIYNARFEEAFAAYVGVRYAAALPSCTAALHLSLLAHGVGPGDEVVVPDVTWIATAAPISYVGATAVFADIDPQTWCLTPAALEECLTPRTKAAIVVDLYSGMADMDGLRAVAARRGIALIEDAAEAVGSQWQGQRAGSFGDTGTFSFHGSKTLTTGEGGMLVTDSEDVYKRVLFLRDHGRAPGDKMFWNSEVAFKYKMSSLQAALGLAQLERVDELVARKRQIFAWYAQALGGSERITLNYEAPGSVNSYWMTTALWDARLPLSKEDAVAHMAAQGIDCRPVFYPLSALPAYASTEQAAQAQARNRVSYDISPRGINLPSALTLTQDDVQRASAALLELLHSRQEGGR